MPRTLEVECPFDRKAGTFTMVARLYLPKGEFVEHVFGTWKMTARKKRFGRFSYSEFTVFNLAEPGRKWHVGSPHMVEDFIARHHKEDLLRFVRRIARGYGCKPSLFLAYGSGLGRHEVRFYRLKPRTTTKSGR